MHAEGIEHTLLLCNNDTFLVKTRCTKTLNFQQTKPSIRFQLQLIALRTPANIQTTQNLPFWADLLAYCGMKQIHTKRCCPSCAELPFKILFPVAVQVRDPTRQLHLLRGRGCTPVAPAGVVFRCCLSWGRRHGWGKRHGVDRCRSGGHATVAGLCNQGFGFLRQAHGASAEVVQPARLLLRFVGKAAAQQSQAALLVVRRGAAVGHIPLSQVDEGSHTLHVEGRLAASSGVQPQAAQVLVDLVGPGQ